MCRVDGFRSHLLAKQEGNDCKKTKQQERLSLKFWESGSFLRHMQRQRRPLSMKMCCMDEMRFVHRLLGADRMGLSHVCGLLTCHPNLWLCQACCHSMMQWIFPCFCVLSFPWHLFPEGCLLMQRPTRRKCLVTSEYFISSFNRLENVSALPFHADWYQLSFKYSARTIPFFNCVAKAHPRNMKLIFLPFCPDGRSQTPFRYPPWWKERSVPYYMGWCKFQKKNNFTSPSKPSANPCCLQSAAFQIPSQMVLNSLLAVRVEH